MSDPMRPQSDDWDEIEENIRVAERNTRWAAVLVLVATVIVLWVALR